MVDGRSGGREPEFLNIGDAAELIGVSRVKLWQWVKAGRLVAFQSEIDRRQKLVRRSDVLALTNLRPIRREDGEDTKAAA